MRTVHEVSKLTGVSIRTLHYYDRIGLLRPAEITGSGYRLYDDTALGRLQCILLFRELQFPLKDIKEILDSPDFEEGRALEQQIDLLLMKKAHLERLIEFAREMKETGVRQLDFTVFDTKKMEEYSAQAKAAWGNTEAYREFEQKNRNRGDEEMKEITSGLMALFAGFGRLRTQEPGDDAVQSQVKKLQEYITEHFYTCTPDILKGLGQMYAAGGEMTENIDKAGGKGTALFAAEAIGIYCG